MQECPSRVHRRGLPRLLFGFRCAFAGCRAAWSGQQNLRIHLLFILAISALAAWLRLDTTRWAVLILTYSIVLAAEFLNSAIESLIDLASPSYHPLAGQAKDIAAGGVLVAACAAVIVGLLLLGPPLWARLLGG